MLPPHSNDGVMLVLSSASQEASLSVAQAQAQAQVKAEDMDDGDNEVYSGQAGSRRRQYTCVYADCRTSRPNKMNNIERHVWTQHIRQTMGMGGATYSARVHKKFVEPYVVPLDSVHNHRAHPWQAANGGGSALKWSWRGSGTPGDGNFVNFQKTPYPRRMSTGSALGAMEFKGWSHALPAQGGPVGISNDGKIQKMRDILPALNPPLDQFAVGSANTPANLLNFRAFQSSTTGLSFLHPSGAYRHNDAGSPSTLSPAETPHLSPTSSGSGFLHSPPPVSPQHNKFSVAPPGELDSLAAEFRAAFPTTTTRRLTWAHPIPTHISEFVVEMDFTSEVVGLSAEHTGRPHSEPTLHEHSLTQDDTKQQEGKTWRPWAQ